MQESITVRQAFDLATMSRAGQQGIEAYTGRRMMVVYAIGGSLLLSHLMYSNLPKRELTTQEYSHNQKNLGITSCQRQNHGRVGAGKSASKILLLSVVDAFQQSRGCTQEAADEFV